MSILPILVWPDPRLSQVCLPISQITDDIRTLAADMLDTMYAAPGRGLAGPQVGAMVRIFVMDTGWKEGAPDPKVCLNPQIDLGADEVAVGAEACLSLPGITADVTRPTTVTLSYTDIDGRECREELEGFAAICAQHEFDHLDGKVTLDRVSPTARAALLAAYEGTK